MIAPPTMSKPRFVRVLCGTGTLLVRSDLRDEGFERALSGGEAELRQRYALKRIRSAASSRVFRFSVRFDEMEKTVYFKEYVDRSVWDIVKHTVRASRARRAFRASLMLAAQGFNVPEMVALGEVRAAFLTKRCFLVTFAVTASQSVYAPLGEDSSRLSIEALRRKRDLIRTLGQTIGRMHARRIVHGDLRPGNILARYEAGRWQLFFLDNERTRRLPWLRARLRRKNLVQVGMLTAGISHTDRIRFWRAYLTECPHLRPRHKQWARRVHARTLERLEKCRRRQASAPS